MTSVVVGVIVRVRRQGRTVERGIFRTEKAIRLTFPIHLVGAYVQYGGGVLNLETSEAYGSTQTGVAFTADTQ